MTKHAPLSPLGAARARLAAPDDSYPTELLAELADAGLGEESLFLAWEVGQWATELSPADRRALVRVVVRSLVALAQGSTRVTLDSAERALCSRAPSVVGAPGSRLPLVLDGETLYHQRLLACEDRLAEALRSRATRVLPAPGDVDAAIAAVMATSRPALTDEQEAAVRATVGGALAVVSGGPGTGKTTIALAMVRTLARLGVPPSSFALAAPTGKAAHRLEEAIKAGLARIERRAPEDEALLIECPPAETLHRLLGYSPTSGAFHHHHNNRLAAKVVLVDESSMVDVFLMERLARAVADDARLVLLGDADQLPSVDAGAVFRDLAPLAVRLTRSHRMDPTQAAGSRVLEVASAVRQGASDDVARLVVVRDDATTLAWEGVERVPPHAREAVLERWHADRFATEASLERLARDTLPLDDGRFGAADEALVAAAHAALARARILCVTHGRPTGVDATNQALHERRSGGGRAAFAPGEPVMMLRNDYLRGLWNGDQGVVVRTTRPGEGPRLAVAFATRGGYRAWDLDGLRDTLALSYATTVHKAQGSEHDVVLVILPEEPIALATRELLYTAITRTRRSAVLVGSAEVLAAAVARSLERSSGLRAKLTA